MTSTQGARAIRYGVRDRLRAALPDLLPLLREQWDRQAAFPLPAHASGNDSPLPEDDAWWTYGGRPVDRWPVIEVIAERAAVRRLEIDTTVTDDSRVFQVTYDVSVYVFTMTEVPEGSSQDDREYATDVRDDLQVAMRIALLDRSIQRGMIALANSYTETYGDPSPAKGQRWEIAGRAQFQVRADERHTRAPVVTVGVGEQPEVDLQVEQLAAVPPQP